MEDKLYEAMGQRFAVVKVVSSEGEWYSITGVPDTYHNNTVVARNLKYSEAQGIIKLLGEENGAS